MSLTGLKRPSPAAEDEAERSAAKRVKDAVGRPRAVPAAAASLPQALRHAFHTVMDTIWGRRKKVPAEPPPRVQLVARRPTGSAPDRVRQPEIELTYDSRLFQNSTSTQTSTSKPAPRLKSSEVQYVGQVRRKSKQPEVQRDATDHIEDEAGTASSKDDDIQPGASFRFTSSGAHVYDRSERQKSTRPLNIMARLRARNPAACVARDFSRPRTPKTKFKATPSTSSANVSGVLHGFGLRSPISPYLNSPMTRRKRSNLRQRAERECVDLGSKDRYAQFLRSMQDEGGADVVTPMGNRGLNIFAQSPFFGRRSQSILSRGVVQVNFQSPTQSDKVKDAFASKFLPTPEEPEVVDLEAEEDTLRPSSLGTRPKMRAEDDDIVEILNRYAQSPELKQPPELRVPRINSLEAELRLKSVTKDDFLEKMMKKYSASARERERRVLQEETRRDYAQSGTKRLEDALASRMKKTLEITEVPVEDVPETEDEEEELPEITEQMETIIRRACNSRGETLVDKFNIPISRKDLDTLHGLNWLNDEVINFYMQMICERSQSCDNWPKVYAFNTFFYPKIMQSGHAPVKRWTRKVDIFAHDLLLIPVHLGMHWCLATVDLRKSSVYYYDSMSGRNHKCLKAILQYLKDEHKDKKKTDLDATNFEAVCVEEIPQQMNGSDCGMFTCKFAEYLSRNAKFSFDQKDMPYFRKRMIYEIVSGNLLHP